MKNDNLVEIILSPKFSPEKFSHEELAKWLGVTVQPVIREQHELTKKFFLKTLKDTPAIYLS